MIKKTSSSVFKIERLTPELYSLAVLFLENIFHEEQNIPKELIPLKNENQEWWCIMQCDEIVGIVAAWKTDSEWHWGRLAVHHKLRGQVLGKKLAMESLDECFRMGIDKVKINARDITVDMILKLGGKITGKKDTFYEQPITPMEIEKRNFAYKTYK